MCEKYTDFDSLYVMCYRFISFINFTYCILFHKMSYHYITMDVLNVFSGSQVFTLKPWLGLVWDGFVNGVKC